ncbi:hypothetical protein ABZ319_04295 [Nocardia sp. NPDC005978]|uniref:hypothetical protein n=1 Tax=Nocardia sp. NPDC005978 TaxID=3156725 RepID=UPI0033AF96B8
MDDERPAGPLDETERAELTRLRREAAARRGSVDGPRSGRSWIRWTATVILLIFVVVLGISAVLARFVRGELLDTDRYVQTVTPLSSDPVIQDGLADRVTAAIMDRIDVQAVTAQALTAITDSAPRVPAAVIGLAPVVEEQAEHFVHETAESVLASDAFDTLWIQANRQAHQKFVTVMRGDGPAAIAMDEDGFVRIELGPIVDRVRVALVDKGFAFADRVPEINGSYVLFQSEELVTAQRYVSMLDRAAGILPWATVLAAACAIWAAPRGARRRVFTWVGAALVAAMALLAVALGIGRSAYLDAVPANVLSGPAAATLIDAVLEPLRTTLRAVLVLGVVIAAAGFLTGSSRTAVAIRGGYGRALAAARSRRADRDPRSIEAFAARFRTPLRVAIIAAAVLTLALWSYPSGLVVIVTVLIAVVALLVVELVGRAIPAEAVTADTAHGSVPGAPPDPRR